jgi:hypothetical protein
VLLKPYNLDGPTTGPKGFSVPLAKALNKVEERSVVAFKPIECELPNMTIAELSSDQNIFCRKFISFISSCGYVYF